MNSVLSQAQSMGQRPFAELVARRVKRPWLYAPCPTLSEEAEHGVARAVLARAIEDTDPNGPIVHQKDAWEWLLAPLYQDTSRTRGVTVEVATTAANLPMFPLLRALICVSDVDHLFGCGAGSKLLAIATKACDS